MNAYLTSVLNKGKPIPRLSLVLTYNQRDYRLRYDRGRYRSVTASSIHATTSMTVSIPRISMFRKARDFLEMMPLIKSLRARVTPHDTQRDV